MFINLAALAICVFVNREMGGAVAINDVQSLAARQVRPIAFNVAPAGQGEISSFMWNGHNNLLLSGSRTILQRRLHPAQASIVITETAGNCHVSLYPQANQQGGVTQRLNTDTGGICCGTTLRIK
ncbi:hypothetical protein CPB84DRAFT_1847538 [Gymnopilus junonius]|uniref:Uncharacterized protein n=1 Tax=Gymnopilus junonius TaxID=109634 RepID=A0A9P5NM03_GYMJU|nr:hypothetical protein CPB84DRAFT_1847538 [Gymnopilus junonius]